LQRFAPQRVTLLSKTVFSFATAISHPDGGGGGGVVEQGWSWHDYHVVSALPCTYLAALLSNRLVGGLCCCCSVCWCGC